MEWISVEDRLPEYYKTVLWFHADGRIFIDFLDEEVSVRDRVGTVSHWMLLPEPPEDA